MYTASNDLSLLGKLMSIHKGTAICPGKKQMEKKSKQRPLHPAIENTLSWQSHRINVQLQLWCFQSWQRHLRTHLENVKSGWVQCMFVTAKIWLHKMPFWAKCFASLSLCLFPPTQNPSCRCLWEKLYLFLDAVGLYSQRQHSKYTASCNSSKYPPWQRLRWVHKICGLPKDFPSVKNTSLHQWWEFYRERGKTLWKHGNGSKISGLCYRQIPIFPFSNKDCRFL